MANRLEMIRVKVPKSKIKYSGVANDFFAILENSQGITEEFLYAHQPTTKNVVNVYSTSDTPIGALDENKILNSFTTIKGPAIVVARKGYAGRLFVVEDERFIVHEDAYPIKPKPQYVQEIDLWWFVGHYSAEFQSDRTSFWGIGDFPRERFRNQEINLPNIEFQKQVAPLYKKRILLLDKLNRFKEEFHSQIDKVIGGMAE
ncbi:restriction endonuclease subunit S [Desulfobacterota bacterium AH_259_B03_O07]|nr:restriction endonuclease subunit S [Desulfobacterota bacterium AH_259_B03_O07]